MNLFAAIYWLFIVSSVIYMFKMAARKPQKNVKSETNFTAVTYFDGIEAYYRSLEGQKLDSLPQESSRSDQRTRVKKSICQNIFGTQFFEMRQVRYVDLETLYSKLKNDYPDIFAAIYRKSRSSPASIDPYEYENAYAWRAVRADGVDEEEYTIMCPVQHGPAGRIREYLVSREYNVNLITDPHTNPIYGRFVFSRGSRDEPFTLVAMAEEPAISLSGSFRESLMVESLYVVGRRNHRLAEIPERDPICALAYGHKLRLCATILGASAFKETGVKFVPSMDNVGVNCLRKRVRLLSPGSSRHPWVGVLTQYLVTGSSSGVYEAWMVECKALSRIDEEILFYVSAAEVENEIFVFEPTTSHQADARVIVHNSFHNVSVADITRENAQPRFLTDDVED